MGTWSFTVGSQTYLDVMLVKSQSCMLLGTKMGMPEPCWLSALSAFGEDLLRILMPSMKKRFHEMNGPIENQESKMIS